MKYLVGYVKIANRKCLKDFLKKFLEMFNFLRTIPEYTHLMKDQLNYTRTTLLSS
jgi:hypothetical protein